MYDDDVCVVCGECGRSARLCSPVYTPVLTPHAPPPYTHEPLASILALLSLPSSPPPLTSPGAPFILHRASYRPSERLDDDARLNPCGGTKECAFKGGEG